MTHATVALTCLATCLGPAPTLQDAPEAPSAMRGGQWAGAYGEISDRRVAWDPFTVMLEVDGDRLGGTFFHTKGGNGTVAGTHADGEARFTVALDGEHLSFTGTLDGDLFRGECETGQETLSFLAVVPDALADSLPLKAPPVPAGKAATLFNEVELRRATLDGDVRIGTHRIEAPELQFNGLLSEVILGRETLAGFVVTFDQVNRRVRFAERE